LPRQLFSCPLPAWASSARCNCSASRSATALLRGYCGPSVHRRPALTRRAVAFRSDRPLRAPLLRFFPLQRFGPRRAIRRCHSAGQSRFSVLAHLGRTSAAQADRAHAVLRSRWRQVYSRHACAGPARIMHRRSPCGGVPLPGRTISRPCRFLQSRQRSWGSFPSQSCSCLQVRRPLGLVRPLAVSQASHPDNFVGGPAAQLPHPHHQRLAAGARRGFWVLSLLASRSRPHFAPGGPILPWALRLSQVFEHRKHRRAGAIFQAADPPTMGAASGSLTLVGFTGGVDVLRRPQDRRTFRDAPLGASPADPSAFVAGA